MIKHTNDGRCSYCRQIINRYPGFYEPLNRWFTELQIAHPEAHTSCAGRGQMDQEALFMRTATRAHWGQSAHNYNAALDMFCIVDGKNIYDYLWFQSVLKPSLEDWMLWYGRPEAPFYELPHVELKDWRKYYLQLV